MLKSKSFIFLTILSVSLVSCGGKDNQKKPLKPKVSGELTNTFNSQDFDYVLPQPISLAKAFQSAGLSYNQKATNPYTNKKNYQTKIKQLLNLGIYSTDLAYSAINEKEQEAREYLKAIQELGNEVGLKAVFSDKKFIERFDQNLGDMEVVEDLIYDIQEKSEQYLEDNDIRYLSVIQFAGAWTEGMYLGVVDIESNPKTNNNLSITIVDQISILKNILKGIKTYPNVDEHLTAVTKKLEAIQSTYNNFESVKEADKSPTFVTPQLSEQEFKALSAKIKELRNYITK